MSRLFYFIFIILGFILLGCSEDDSGNPGSSPDPDIVITPPTGNENYLNVKSDYIFDQSKLHTFQINLSPTALAQIDADPAAEEYVEGSLTFEGETLGQVGIRYKGSIGAFVGCVTGSDWTHPSGRKTCTKLSMKIKINWKDKDDKFYDLKKLQFHSQNLDPSQMRDRLGYWLFGEMGVPAPRSVHARLVINGVYSGLYALVEQIDGRFSRYHFEDGKGNLYKEVWPIDYQGRAQSEDYFLRALETNEEDNPTAAMIRGFGQEIAQSNDVSIKDVILNNMNIREIMAYAVVDRMIRVDDGPFHWYCGGGGCDNHNYYWYEEPTLGTLHLIPWDLDNAFENIVSDRNPVTPIADEWGQISFNCNSFNYGTFNLSQRSAACDKLIGGWASFIDEYEQVKSEFIEGPFAEDVVNGLIDQWAAQIREATFEADQLHNDALSLSRWDNAVRDLKSSLSFARTQ